MPMPARLSAALIFTAVCAVAPPACPAAAPPNVEQIMKALGIAKRDQVIGFASSRLNRDQTEQTIVITCRARVGGHPLGGDVVALERKGGALVPVWRQRRLNPWKLAIADVDGDGRREIAVGVWKKSPKDPTMAKRTFFYTWNGKRMLPKWLGSRLSRRFTDFTLADINRDGWDELIALEVAPKGLRRIAAYRWHSFGFAWLGCTPDVAGFTRLSTAGGRAVAAGKRSRAVVGFSRGNVVLAYQRN